jgi:hypothetical protein
MLREPPGIEPRILRSVGKVGKVIVSVPSGEKSTSVRACVRALLMPALSTLRAFEPHFIFLHHFGGLHNRVMRNLYEKISSMGVCIATVL